MGLDLYLYNNKDKEKFVSHDWNIDDDSILYWRGNYDLYYLMKSYADKFDAEKSECTFSKDTLFKILKYFLTDIINVYTISMKSYEDFDEIVAEDYDNDAKLFREFYAVSKMFYKTIGKERTKDSLSMFPEDAGEEMKNFISSLTNLISNMSSEDTATLLASY